MNQIHVLVCYAGCDPYDHDNRVTQVGVESILDPNDIEHKFAAYKKHCLARLKSGSYAWAALSVVHLTIDGSMPIRHWAEQTPVKEKIKLNKEALNSPPKLKGVTLADIQEALEHAQYTTTVGLNTVGFWADPPDAPVAAPVAVQQELGAF